MANTASQAKAVRDLLVERLELFNSSLDVSEGSPLWNEVIYPVFQALGTDPFDTDIYEFLRDRIRQEFPTIGAEEGDTLVDLLITPLELLIEPLKREIQVVRQGQSANSASTMRLEDAQDLAANFFTEWSTGSRSIVTVRVYFASPTYVNVFSTATFSTATGLNFFPLTSQVTRPETMLLQRSGTEYYVDVQVIAEKTGDEYDVDKGAITSVSGLSGWVRVTNLAASSGGAPAETAEKLLTRTRSSLTERSLNVRRGIIARLTNDFPSIVDAEVTGYGDPEMDRDVLTGSGEGSVVSTGICIIVGQFVLMFSMFEQRGSLGTAKIAEGDEIELNYWKFLYDVDATGSNERFKVDSILFDSRGAISEMPSVLLFRIDGVPSVTAPVAGALPGVLPAVFCVVRSSGKIEISDIPGGIQNPETSRGTIEIEDGEVHIGGHYDVWLRPGSSTSATADISSGRSESAHLEGTDLTLNGEGLQHTHLVHRTYTITFVVSTSALQVGETITGDDSGAVAVVHKATKISSSIYTYELKEMNGIEFAVEDIQGSVSGAAGGISSVDSYDFDSDGLVTSAMLLSVVSGSDVGVYRILKVEGPFLYLNIGLTTTAVDQYFRILSEITVDLFSPKRLLVPFGEADGSNLRTTIGSKVVRAEVNLQDYGVQVGDTLEIVEGDDRGTFSIQSWDPDYGGAGPVLGVEMTATNSGLEYRVYRPSSALQRPLIRVTPGGVTMLDPAGRDSGYKIPYALPVEGRAKDAFSGSKAVAAGANGFLLMDPGSSWAPTGDYVVDIDGTDWATDTGSAFDEFYEEGNFKRVFTDGALEGDGYLAVLSIYSDGFTYLDSSLPTSAADFLSSMKQWFLDMISTFNFGGDEAQLVELLSPLKLGPHADPASVTLLMQFEILIPFEVFDGCNNVFVAVPEFDWESEFASSDTFEDAMDDLGDGSMRGNAPALLQAKSGDTVTLLAGANAGAYVIDAVYEYKLVQSSHIDAQVVDLSKAYRVAVAVIRDQFPVPAFQGLASFFEESVSWDLPSAPDLPYTVTDDATGLPVDGWGFWVETSLTWFFTWMRNLGFELPSSVELDVPETMKALWQLLFTSYIVGKPTADQYTRLYFMEPTSCTTFAPQVCARYSRALPTHTGAAHVSEEFTLPIPDLEGLEVELTVQRLSDSFPLSGELPASAGTASTISALAVILQALLDPDEEYVLFTGPATATGALTITQVNGGVDEWSYVSAAGSEGFRWLGFFEADPGRWPIADIRGAIGAIRTIADEVLASQHGFKFRTTAGSLQLLRSGVAPSGTFLLGETVTGSDSGATGVVWAAATDSSATEAYPTRLLLEDVSGTFTSAENITGDTSGAIAANIAVGIALILPFQAVTIAAGTYTWNELAALVETQFSAAFKDYYCGGDASAYDGHVGPNAVFSVEYVDENGDENGSSLGTFRLAIEITDNGSTGALGEFEIESPASGSDFAVDYLGGAALVTVSLELEGPVLADPYSIADLELHHDNGAVQVLASSLSYTEAGDFDTEITALLSSGDFDEAAVLLNSAAYAYLHTLLSVRYVLFVGGADLYIRTIEGGPDVSFTLTSGYDELGFVLEEVAGTQPDANSAAQGSTVPTNATTISFGHQEPTLLVAAAGAAELLFVPSLAAEALSVFPGQTSDGIPKPTGLPRDLHIGTAYDDQTTIELAFSDTSFEAPVEFGAKEGSDFIDIFEQRRFLELTTEESDAMIARDRVVAVRTSFGSNKVSLLSFEDAEFTFLAPNSGLFDDEVQVGDLLFIEEGESLGSYTITARSAEELTLDRPLDESTATLYRAGHDGLIEPDASEALFSSDTALFSSDDIGRFLTIWSNNREQMDGSFRISAVATDGGTTIATLETDVFDFTEQDIHWAVVKAPVEDPEASGINGRTALVGLRPVRIYSGIPSSWRIARVTPELDRITARIFCSMGTATEGPKTGVKQPYRVVRPGVQHLSASAMALQREKGLYYFDVLTHSLGGDDIYNLPRGTRMEPVFGTFETDGYRVETEDTRTAFSSDESATMVLSAAFLPQGFADEPSNLVALEGKSVRVAYEYAPVVAQVQRMMSSETDRVLCANVLVRHFLPSYVYFHMNYEGGNLAGKVGAEIQGYINSLPSEEELDVSKLEKILHANQVVRYDHPVEVITLTHDLDRRIVAHRSENRLSDDDIAFNGTNRTTFFIAGKDHSAKEEADIPDGERLFLRRVTPSSTLR
jgi:hypothetical protein